MGFKETVAKLRKKVLPVFAAGVILTGATLGATLGLTGCSLPTSPSGNGQEQGGQEQGGGEEPGKDPEEPGKEGGEEQGGNEQGGGGEEQGGGETPEPDNGPKLSGYTYNYQTPNIVFTKNGIEGFDMVNLPPKEYNPDWVISDWDENGNIQATITESFISYLIEIEAQSNNLKNGYTAVANAYPELAAILGGNDSSGIRGSEQNNYDQIEQTTDVAAYIANATGSGINNVLSGILTGNDAKLYEAYTKGHYYDQKIRGDRNALLTDFQSACNAAGFSYTGNVTNDLQTIKAQLLNKINNAMGLSNIANEADRNKISGLNGHLLSQLEDLHQFRALAADYGDPALGYSTDFGGTTIQQYKQDWEIVVQQSGGKATHLASGFDPALLQGNGKKIEQAEIV
jgi:hypothetical protein